LDPNRFHVNADSSAPLEIAATLNVVFQNTQNGPIHVMSFVHDIARQAHVLAASQSETSRSKKTLQLASQPAVIVNPTPVTSDQSKLSSGAVAGIVFAILAAVAIVVAVSVFYYKRAPVTTAPVAVSVFAGTVGTATGITSTA